MTSVFALLSKPRWRWSAYTLSSLSIFLLGTFVGFAALIGVGDKLYYLFYLLFLPIIWVAMREGYVAVALALVTVQLTLAATTVFVGYDTKDFAILQLLMLVLSITGLLLGAVTTERLNAALLLRQQQTELARMADFARVGAMGMELAHEISQPLSTVATYLHAARRLLQSSVASEPVMDALIKAEAEAQRAREVLERIRDFVSNGNLDLQALDLSALAEKIAALCREEATTRGIRIENESIRPIPPVKADRVQIEQVLNNLVANAIDAASERSDARGHVIIRVAARDDAVIMQVEDNGPGVAPELAARIFDAYQTTKPRGMGLGLPLSQRIVQRHAGRLWWEPNRPEGARFVVALPIDGSIKMPRERCVHIVDDEARVRDALTLLLSTAQIKSRCYCSAEEYLSSNPLEEPACVLLDNQLPGMSGLELLKHIVAAASNSAVIMITAYGDVPTAVLAMKAGAFHFVQKPFDAEALLTTVEEALSRADEVRDVPRKQRNSRLGSRC